MNNLIIFTGMTCTGKSTITEQVAASFASAVLIHVDQFEEQFADMVGYSNTEQRALLRSMSHKVFVDTLSMCMERQDKLILIEYPFDETWGPVFNELIKKHNYNALTVKVLQPSVDSIWADIAARKLEGKRHIIHFTNAYNPRRAEDAEPRIGKTIEDIQDSFNNQTYTKMIVGKTLYFILKEHTVPNLVRNIVSFIQDHNDKEL